MVYEADGNDSTASRTHNNGALRMLVHTGRLDKLGEYT